MTSQGSLLAWILDCGASEHAASGKNDVVSKPRPVKTTTTLLTGNGVIPVTQEVSVRMPGVPGTRDALLNKFGPNMASLGRLIYDDNFVVKRWDKQNGLLLDDSDGNPVPNYVNNYVPRLGVPSLASLSDEQVMTNIHLVVDAIVQAIDEVASEFVGAVSGAVRDVASEMRSAVGSVGEVRRRLNYMTAVGSEKPIPLAHFLTHLPKLPWCPYCEAGKMQRMPARRVPKVPHQFPTSS